MSKLTNHSDVNLGAGVRVTAGTAAGIGGGVAAVDPDPKQTMKMAHDEFRKACPRMAHC
jgi:hypothetical protein